MKLEILSSLKDNIEAASVKLGWNGIDDTVAEQICFTEIQKIFSDAIYNKKSKSFPDIYSLENGTGFEVKKTNSGDGTLGNSVTQKKPKVLLIYSIWFRIDLEKVYIHPYANIIQSIKVDHNPRFYLKLPTSTITDDSFFKNHSTSFQSYLELSIAEKNTFLKNYLKSDSSIETWRWFMGEDQKVDANDTLYNLLRIAQENWSQINSNEVRLFIFENHLNLLSGKKIDWHAFDPIIFKKFNAIGPIKDVCTAGGKINHLPALITNFLNNLHLLKSKIDPINLPSWKKEAKSFINSKKNKGSQNFLTKRQASDILKIINE